MHVAASASSSCRAGFKGSFYEDYKRHIAAGCTCSPCCTRRSSRCPGTSTIRSGSTTTKSTSTTTSATSACPKPGTIKQLEELVGRLHSNFLDRSRPLWEFYVIDGLADNRLAIYTKIHHAAVDGGAGMVLTNMMYDTTPVPRRIEPAGAEERRRSGARRARPARRRLQEHAQPACQRAAEDSRRPEGDRQRRGAGRSAASRGCRSRDCRTWSRRRRCSTRRSRASASFTARSLPLADAKAIGKLSETKLNDVVMAVCAGALRRYLLEKHGAAEGAAGRDRCRCRCARPATPRPTTRSRECCAASPPTSRTRSSA